MSQSGSALAVDLGTCATEPIHTPGAIQPQGVLIVCKAGTWTVTHASSNVASVMGVTVKRLLGRDLSGADFLGAETADRLARAVADVRLSKVQPRRGLAIPLEGFKRRLAASVHEHDGRRILELEPAPQDAAAPLDLVGAILQELQKSKSIRELCDATVDQMRSLSGFDRVMIYRFLPDGSGHVIAEAGQGPLGPLLGLRYPASDIPPQARDLYKRSWIRLIADVAAKPVPLVAGEPADAAPVDLSYAALRSVSPIHIQYLENMGVGASMSISIIVGGELWGLIAFHHGIARAVPAHIRAAAELIGQVFSLQIQTVEGIEAYVTMRAARAFLDRVVAEFPIGSDLLDGLASRLDQLAAFLPNDGVGLWLDGNWRSVGVAPHRAAVPALARLLDRNGGQGLTATHRLLELHQEARQWGVDIAGVLAVPLSHAGGDYLFFFRRELAQTIGWAGDPSKAVTAAGPAGALGPRRSFALWREEVRGQSAPWTSRERLIGETLRVYLVDVIVRFSDVILTERRQAEQRQRLLASELGHRVKGTFELIQSLVARGGEASASVGDLVRTLQRRIGAVALAHDAVALQSGCDLRGLIEMSLGAQGAGDARVVLEGPPVRLMPKAYTVLCLVVHELVAGAFEERAPGLQMRLDVSWAVQRDGDVSIAWQDRGPRRASRPRLDDVGLLIVRHNIPHTLGGAAEVDIGAEDLSARFTLPARHVVSDPACGSGSVQRAQEAAVARPLEGVTVLVVDDEMLSAFRLADELKTLGAAQVHLAGTLDAAAAMIAEAPPDCAVLDIDLGETTSLALADRLADEGVPFVFAGAPSAVEQVSQRHRGVAVASKPYAAASVAALLREALMPMLIRAVLTKLV